MSKLSVQRKSTLKKPRQDRDLSIDARVSDDETNRRRLCYQLIQKEKQRKLLAINDIRKNNNQLDILRELLSNERDIDELMLKSNGILQLNRTEKLNSKNNVRNGKNQYNKKTKPTSAKNFNSSSAVDWNQSEEDNLPVNSAGEDEIEDEPVRLSRSNKKTDQQRSVSLYSQSRQQLNGTRSINNVSFISDVSKNGGKINGNESNMNVSSSQLNKLLDRLSLELNDLELITGFKSDKNDQSLSNQSNTCSAAIISALIILTGHIKQSALNSKGKQEINYLKDQLSVVIKTQLDFQQKIENQMTTLQTMMQTICQLVNNEIISKRKYEDNRFHEQSPTINYSQPQQQLSRLRRDQTDFELAEPRQNWLSNVQRQSVIPKHNAMDDLLTFAQRMNNATPIDTNIYRQSLVNPSNNRHSAYTETLEASKNLIRPTSSLSTNETNGSDISKPIQQHRNIEQDSRLSMISPIDTPSSYDIFESSLPNGNSSASIYRNGLNGISTTVPSASMNETILEKILQERLRLVQQMAELSKQHETTQEELANLEAKTMQHKPK